jgi:hypothetical protein
MLNVNELVGFGAAAGAPTLNGSFIGNTYIAGPVTNWNTTSVSIGTEASDRYVILVLTEVMQSADAGTSSITINGVSANRVTYAGTVVYNCSVWIALVPTGTLVTISGVRAGFANQSVFGIYTVSGQNLNSTTPVSSGTDVEATAVKSVFSVPVYKPYGALVVAGHHDWTNGPIVWGGISNVNYNYQPAGNSYFSGASEIAAQDEYTSVTSTITTNYPSGLVVAVFR